MCYNIGRGFFVEDLRLQKEVTTMTQDRPHSKHIILVVEDDPDISNMLRIYFESRDYKVAVAPRGNTALELCQQELPSVVVLDIILPDIDGYQVCQRLKSEPRTRDVPVIFLTQKGERADRIAGLGFGADDYITKPFDIAELEASVEKLIAGVLPE
jgi:DNA-binding response OmpR family regulator